MLTARERGGAHISSTDPRDHFTIEIYLPDGQGGWVFSNKEHVPLDYSSLE